MAKVWIVAILAPMFLAGCASVPMGAIPVKDSSGSLQNDEQAAFVRANGGVLNPASNSAQAVAAPQESGVVVMVPGVPSRAPLQVYSDGSNAAPASYSVAPMSSLPNAQSRTVQSSLPSVSSVPTGVPATASLAGDEQLDGPVLALLTGAQKLQASGDLDGASSSLERAQRIAPREPQVLYRLAEVRLAQGDAAQAEQLARRGLTYSNGRPTLQAGLWGLIAQARERLGDAAGAAQARSQARVVL